MRSCSRPTRSAWGSTSPTSASCCTGRCRRPSRPITRRSAGRGAMARARCASCCAGELGRGFVWLRTPSEEELEDWLPHDKRERDLRGLLAMLEYAKSPRCLKLAIHEHFGIPSLERCDSCDRCVDVHGWLDTHV